ncbi:hypothetical protein P152DRAFT_290301 [Eremomyces bilateralis CBS 781.70]|uniref:Uncharacterized protein n=1 Tax=Eremomyces bilateralis CBS 781.70 TaxID=1392243 RepID=A0A6G1G6T9_9PEZI|nr:uncharacterized protein P152DRAFT_290301 [Eremomyces bilateralis CBS 781.70]KAF1813744.1 hypothetical protein P152DRAFT_290301 [Eremomyces bilateralis CBS 781.70]
MEHNHTRQSSYEGRLHLDGIYNPDCIMKENVSMIEAHSYQFAARYFSGQATMARLQHEAAEERRLNEEHRLVNVDTNPRGTFGPKILYAVAFKCDRIDVYHVPESVGLRPKVGDMVIVDGDRGTDLGCVTAAGISVEEAKVVKEKSTQNHIRWSSAARSLNSNSDPSSFAASPTRMRSPSCKRRKAWKPSPAASARPRSMSMVSKWRCSIASFKRTSPIPLIPLLKHISSSPSPGISPRFARPLAHWPGVLPATLHLHQSLGLDTNKDFGYSYSTFPWERLFVFD